MPEGLCQKDPCFCTFLVESLLHTLDDKQSNTASIWRNHHSKVSSVTQEYRLIYVANFGHYFSCRKIGAAMAILMAMALSYNLYVAILTP